MAGLLSGWSKKRDASKALKAGRQFLLENAKKEGVVTTASGLQYKIIKAGEGPKAKAWHKVTVHYKGTFLDGSEFDSTNEESGPATFLIGEVIHGWAEALKLMSVGSIHQLFIPSELAYGSRGAGGDIGPNETLIFRTELLELS
jgi:FKBP-type peptidyl-prolyl cis-trans isomerase